MRIWCEAFEKSGHQSALLAGLMEARESYFDLTVSMDFDGWDDIDVMAKMVERYHSGCDVLYGVRSSRDTDTIFKRMTVEAF